MVTAYNTRTGGLIPARAGKTIGFRLRWRRLAAHPRSRGENEATLDGIPHPAGSSPLARGKLCRVTCSGQRAGLIPARAGKTR